MLTRETVNINGSTLLATNFPSSFFYTGILKEVRYRPGSSLHWPATSVDLLLYRGTGTGAWRKSGVFKQCIPGGSEVSFFPRNLITTSATEVVTRHSSHYADVSFVDQKFLVRVTTCLKDTALNCYVDLYFEGLQYRTSERGARTRNQTSMLNL